MYVLYVIELGIQPFVWLSSKTFSTSSNLPALHGASRWFFLVLTVSVSHEALPGGSKKSDRSLFQFL
jgi:hypothetical protein